MRLLDDNLENVRTPPKVAVTFKTKWRSYLGNSSFLCFFLLFGWFFFFFLMHGKRIFANICFFQCKTDARWL